MRLDEVQMVEVTGRYSYTSCQNYAFRINGGYAQIFKGNMRASGFEENFFHLNNNNDDDEIMTNSSITHHCRL